MMETERKSNDPPWIKHRITMTASPAFQALGLVERRILDCLEIEHCRHAGKANGELKMTYGALKNFGVGHNNIAPGLRAVIALGFVAVERLGGGGNAGHRRPSLYRLTYLPAHGVTPTDDWAAIPSRTVAEAIAKTARTKKRYKPRPKPTTDVVGLRVVSGGDPS